MPTLNAFQNEKEEKIIRAILQALYGKDSLQLLERNGESGNPIQHRNELRKEFRADRSVNFNHTDNHDVTQSPALTKVTKRST